ncbi:MAG: glycosyltransferase family 2 protein [Nitriliruptorales bacterium]
MTAGPWRGGRTLIVIPAWNEQAGVGTVVREVREHLSDVDVLVVDDGSDDDTAEVAEAAGAWVLRLPYNLGVGGAMRAGYRFAYRRGYKAVVQIDADGQHDPAEASRLLDGLDHADVVIGARFAGRGNYEVRGPRRWAMRFLSRAVSRLAGRRLTDVTSGFRACGPGAIEVFARDYPVEFLGDTVESLVIAAHADLRIDQVAAAMRERFGGQPSKNPLSAAAYAIRALVVVSLVGIRRGTPGFRRRRST